MNRQFWLEPQSAGRHPESCRAAASDRRLRNRYLDRESMGYSQEPHPEHHPAWACSNWTS